MPSWPNPLFVLHARVSVYFRGGDVCECIFQGHDGVLLYSSATNPGPAGSEPGWPMRSMVIGIPHRGQRSNSFTRIASQVGDHREVRPAALSGPHSKAPGFAGGYLLTSQECNRPRAFSDRLATPAGDTSDRRFTYPICRACRQHSRAVGPRMPACHKPQTAHCWHGND